MVREHHRLRARLARTVAEQAIALLTRPGLERFAAGRLAACILRNQPHADVGGQQQDHASQQAGGQQAARLIADEGPQDVRHHEADETDRPRDRDPRSDGERGADDAS